MNRTFWLFILALCVAGSADYAPATDNSVGQAQVSRSTK